MSNISIWHIDRALSGATTPDKSGPGSNSNEKVVHTPQSSRARATPLDGLISYPLIGVWPLSKDEVGEFYGYSRLGCLKLES